MGNANIVHVLNTAPIEFPETANAQPRSINGKQSITDPVVKVVEVFIEV